MGIKIMNYQIGGAWVEAEQPGERFEDDARHAILLDLPLVPDEPEEGDRPTPVMDQEAILAMFREADGGCWGGPDDEDD